MTEQVRELATKAIDDAFQQAIQTAFVALLEGFIDYRPSPELESCKAKYSVAVSTAIKAREAALAAL
jgi:hypothetical protein